MWHATGIRVRRFPITVDHIAADRESVALACAATAPNVDDTLVFDRVFLTAFAAKARTGPLKAAAPHLAKDLRELPSFII